MLVDRLLGQPNDAREALAAQRRRQLNFDPAALAHITPENGWRVDDVREVLPREATAFVNALGYFELYVNGKKVSDHVLEPTTSDFSRDAVR